MYCPKCGTQNDDNNFRCAQCQEILHPSAPPMVIDQDNTMGGMMPTGNGPALAAYYLGVFSVIPFVGIPLGIFAAIMGIRGLRKIRENPAVKGKIHSWVGIIAGGLFAFAYSIVLVLIIVYSGRS